MEKIVKSGERVTHVTLDGTECAVRFSAEYRVFYVKSEGGEVLVSLRSGAVRGDDGTLICPSGGSVGYPHMRHVNTVYLTGTGDVTVFAGNEADAAPFKSAAQGGGAANGSGVSQSYVDSRDNAILDAAKNYSDSAAKKINAKNAIACDTKPTYADGTITYVKGGATYTTTDTETWFYYTDGEELKQTIFVDGEEFTITSAGKVDFTEFVANSDVASTYTGSEGDTSKIPDLAALRMLDAKITGNISNANLLINPDFRINQRGKAEYSGIEYTVDRWYIKDGELLTVTNDGITVTCTNTLNRVFIQTIEIPEYMIGRPMTLSVNITEVSGRVVMSVDGIGININNVGIVSHIFTPTSTRIEIEPCKPSDVGAYVSVAWAKLEFGSIATPFVPPDPSTELVKCQRYYQLRSTGDIAAADMRPTMRTTPTITQLSDGNYAYDAEIY